MTTDRRPLALVTGASGGIGADLARELARDGHDLVLVARGVAPMEALASELAATGARSTVITANLAAPGAAAGLTREVEGRGMEVDVLINNAGFGDSAPFQQADPGKLAAMLALNVVALTELTRLFLPGMVARGRGKVLLVASTAAFQPVPGMAAYGATKAYVLSLGEAVASELAGTGVTVTTLCPGPTHTGFASAANVEGALFFRSRLMPPMDSAAVARLGYRGLKAGRRVVITGLPNKLLAFGGRLSPHRISSAISRSLLSNRPATPGG
jgi:short-subunit dehydrogenase